MRYTSGEWRSVKDKVSESREPFWNEAQRGRFERRKKERKKERKPTSFYNSVSEI